MYCTEKLSVPYYMDIHYIYIEQIPIAMASASLSPANVRREEESLSHAPTVVCLSLPLSALAFLSPKYEQAQAYVKAYNEGQ